MSDRVCATIVTFNRKELLIECLEGLFNQTKKLEAVVLVDNCSSDGTELLLKEKGYISKLPNLESCSRIEENLNDIRFIYIRLPQNEGGAGGFHESLKAAFNEKFDWYWLMDDDVAPVSDGLETMLKYSNISKCIHPSKTFPDGSRFIWEGKLNLKTGFTKWLGDASFENGKDYVEVNYGCFEGMLIHHDIVEKIGHPDKRFFIYGDDLVYGLLASHHTKVLYIKDVVLEKKIFNENKVEALGIKSSRISDFAVYFNIRNHFLLMEYLKNEGSNIIILYLCFIAKLVKKILGIIIFDKKLKRLKMLSWGVLDGLRANYSGHRRFLS